MAQQIYVTIAGAVQGPFKSPGTGPQKGRIPVVSFDLEVESPRDPSTGQASGKRQFKPVVFSKEVDAASPQILAALVADETLKEVQFDFVKISSVGKEVVYHTIKLTNATVASFEESQQIGEPGGPVVDSRPLDKVSLVFQKIEMVDIPGGTSASDDWQIRA